MAQRVNTQVAAKISELVAEGLTDPYEVRKALRYYVSSVICANSSSPDTDDRAYYPTIRDLRNHIYKAKKSLELSKLDQENLRLKIEEWKKCKPDSVFFFQPFIKSEKGESDPEMGRYPIKEPHQENEISCESNEFLHETNTHFEQSLMWIHQTHWQREILKRYGNVMTMIDATYKTTKYNIPLFFITVRTNCGYTVVAEFIVQEENAVRIEEALTVLKEWNLIWNPKFIMCDYSEAEIMAMESTFPSTTVYICDFHREQSWER